MCTRCRGGAPSRAWPGQNEAVMANDSIADKLHGVGSTCKHENDDGPKFFVDLADTYLPRLPSVSKTYSPLMKDGSESEEHPAENSKRLRGQVGLNVLLIGTVDGRLEMFAFGVFPIGGVDTCVGKELSVGIISADLSDDFGWLEVALEGGRRGGGEG